MNRTDIISLPCQALITVKDLTPVILTTQEAEIRRISVRNQPWKNHLGDPISKKTLSQKRTGGVAQAIRAPASQV
jgi:hypothetical protein